jgi:Mrp family chromosome partitioning ATPase
MAPAARAALAEIEAAYAPDLTLIDTAPLAAGPAAQAALKLADAAIILAEANKTTIQQIDAAEHTIANCTNILGTIITKA